MSNSSQDSKPKPYPTQPSAPQLQAPMQQAQVLGPYPQPGMYQPMPGMPPPPPTYDQAMHHPVAPSNYAQPQWAGQLPAGATPYYGHPQQGYGGHPYYPQQQPTTYVVQQTPATTVVVPGAFDAGARFDSTSQVRIPPPPPGIPPNMAQIAQANGQNVQVGQRPNNYLVGGSNGGMVFW